MKKFLIVSFLLVTFLLIILLIYKDTNNEYSSVVERPILETKDEVLELEDKYTEIKFDNQEENIILEKKTEKSVNNILKLNLDWNIQFVGELDHNTVFDLYIIDLFETSENDIETLKKNKTKVICYFSAGSAEDFREDYGSFPKKVMGLDLSGWEGEKWLDISNYELFSDIILSRMDLAKEKGCDGVDLDNVDGYTNETGFDLSYQDQLVYNKWLANEAHKRNLIVSLKNDLNQIPDLVKYFDFAVNEQCFYFKECHLLKPFIDAGKPVLNIEYDIKPENFCDKSKDLNFNSIYKNKNLDKKVTSCN